MNQHKITDRRALMTAGLIGGGSLVALATVGTGSAMAAPAPNDPVDGVFDVLDVADGALYADANGASMTNPLTLSNTLTVSPDTGQAALFQGPVAVEDQLSADSLSVGAPNGAQVQLGGAGIRLQTGGGDGASDDAMVIVVDSGNRRGLYVQQTSRFNNQAPVTVQNAGTGPALYVENNSRRNTNYVGFLKTDSPSGSPLHLAGGRAQLNMAPGAYPGHPRYGVPGDLFLDSKVSLWLCKGGRNWKLLG